MLQINVPDREFLDDKTYEFITLKGAVLTLEHSLVSISKWEAKHKKPFFSDNSMSIEESKDYIKCMTLTKDVPDYVYSMLTEENIKSIQEYISDPMTATTFSNINEYVKPKKPSKNYTSEEIYFYMTAYNIPFECQKWHINRLLTLIRIADEKNKPPKKMSKKAQYEKWDKINEQRKKAPKTKG